jgi:hypothetical protein
MMWKWLALAMLMLGTEACRNPAGPGPTQRNGRVECNVPESMPVDALTITAATIDGDTLTLVVNHGGGCERHDYALYGCSATIKTNPLGVDMRLSHNANGDMCDAFLTDTLRFSLAPVRHSWKQQTGQDHGELSLHIQSPPTSISSGQVVRFTF